MRRALVLILVAPAIVTLTPGGAAADERSIIRNPGDHPKYVFEAEPHLLLGYAGPFEPDGSPGVGFRGTVNITDGFVKTINNSVGIGFGLDIGTNGNILVPIVMQWNFWLSTHWSVFGEPGFAVGIGTAQQRLARVLRGRPISLHGPDRADPSRRVSGYLGRRLVLPVERDRVPVAATSRPS